MLPPDFVRLILPHDRVIGRVQVRGCACEIAQLSKHVLECLHTEVVLILNRVPEVDVLVEFACMQSRGGLRVGYKW